MIFKAGGHQAMVFVKQGLFVDSNEKVIVVEATMLMDSLYYHHKSVILNSNNWNLNTSKKSLQI